MNFSNVSCKSSDQKQASSLIRIASVTYYSMENLAVDILLPILSTWLVRELYLGPHSHL